MSYIKDNLILDFDTNDINQIDFNLTSKTKWKYTKVNNQNLNDYGLNQYDIGLSNNLIEGKSINDNYFKLERIGKPTGNGITYDTFDLNIEHQSNVGTYIRSNGGYFINPFKIYGYDIEYLPRKFNNGFTFETTLLIDSNTFNNIDDNSNIFLSLGVRAEDKFVNSYSGNTTYVTSNGSTLNNSNKIYDVSSLKENTQNIQKISTINKTQKLYIKNNNQNIFIIEDLITDDIKITYNQTILIKDTDYTLDLRNKTLTLLNISTNINDDIYINYYGLIDDINLVNINLSEIDNHTTDNKYGIENNLICFKFDKLGRIGYKKIDEQSNIEEVYSEEKSFYLSWNHIVITFRPNDVYNYDNIIDDECLLTNPRIGTLKIFVNGILYLKNENFIEPLFNPYPIDKSKQIGVPYNLSWGGGFVGLKNSYNFNGNDFSSPYSLNNINNNLFIQNNFDGYFKGGFQKLRIYDKYFNSDDVKFNYKFESEFYLIKYNKGGRIIEINN